MAGVVASLHPGLCREVEYADVIQPGIEEVLSADDKEPIAGDG